MPFKELLSLTVSIPLFLFLSVLYPQIQPLLIVLWVCGLVFDVYTTYQFYLEDPSRFQENEQNKIFGYLTKKVGFKKATILFPILIEIPLLLFFAMLPLQILQTRLFPTATNNLLTRLTTSFGIAAVGHLQAATKNTKYNHKNR